MINTSNYVKTYTTLSDLTGGEKNSKEEIIKKISKVPLGGVFIILSQMNSYGGENLEIRKIFLDYLKSIGSKDLSQVLGDSSLYSEQGLLTLWKWFFVYGNYNSINESVDPIIGVNQIIHLCIAVSDYLCDEISEEKANNYFFSNSVFNNKSNLGSDLARSSLIFGEIAQNENNFVSKDFIDINKMFSDKYGYSIQDYLAIIYGLIAGFLNKGTSNAAIRSDWNKSINYFDKTHNPDLGKKIIDEISTSFLDAKIWAQTSINNPWDYTLFRQKPLLKLENGNFYPINLSLLFDKVLSDLYFKIRETSPKNSTQIISFFGKCFEKYVEIITKETLGSRKNNIPYEFIPEFSYGNKRSNKSPDALIRVKDTLLAVEAKVYRLKMDSLFGVKPAIESDTKRFAIDPINQMQNRLSELKTRSHQIMNGISKIYLISLTFGYYPTLKPFEEMIDQMIDASDLPIKGIIHMDIEEYEFFLELISRKASSPASHYLENKKQLAPYTSFKNFLFSSSLYPKRPQYIKDKILEHSNNMRETLFQTALR
ncbi:hypothetical protein AOU00_01325 [Paenibacillus polymyxa]|uniref:hypothetical protein n=1 Tax=Paenibacillus polymyxa TaxID=1406 RepID=UPI0008461D17|nr:hypothetical protein AOU00_01325 [Paenibacillus polymyxa]